MANTSKNSLGYRINYREGTISVSERLIKEANRNGIGSVAHNTLKALMKMGMPIVKYRENTNARKGLTYLDKDYGISQIEDVKPFHIKHFLLLKQEEGKKPQYINDLLKVYNWIDYASGYRNLAEAWEYECSHYFENQISEQYEDSLNGYKVIYSLTDDSVVLLWIDGPLKVTITADYYTEETGVDSFAAYFNEFIAAPVLDSLRAVDGETVR